MQYRKDCFCDDEKTRGEFWQESGYKKKKEKKQSIICRTKKTREEKYFSLNK